MSFTRVLSRIPKNALAQLRTTSFVNRSFSTLSNDSHSRFGSSSKPSSLTPSRLASAYKRFEASSSVSQIMADYVHQEMTRKWIMMYFRLFQLIVIKDVFLLLTDL